MTGFPAEEAAAAAEAEAAVLLHLNLPIFLLSWEVCLHLLGDVKT